MNCFANENDFQQTNCVMFSLKDGDNLHTQESGYAFVMVFTVL